MCPTIVTAEDLLYGSMRSFINFSDMYHAIHPQSPSQTASLEIRTSRKVVDSLDELGADLSVVWPKLTPLRRKGTVLFGVK